MTKEPATNQGAIYNLDEKPINVLLVDDDETWAQFMAGDLEAHDTAFQVTPAFSANKAILSLQDDESIDCVVTDYRMPEIDGLQLLERVREDQPELPFLLVTGRGSEDVASEAIKSGVSDYIQKDPQRDQTSVFAKRIRSAVEQFRLQRAVADSEQRYRTVTEQSQDAIAILQAGRIVFHNRRLRDITGVDESKLSGSEFLESFVHPEDREEMRQTVLDWQNADPTDHLHEVRLRTETGEVRHCECTGGSITYRDEPAVLLSIRDVTRREHRERELRWERSLNRNIQRALLESRTRERLERAITEHLSEYGYELVWIGESSETELHPRAIQGAESYLQQVDLALEGADTDSEPSIWAARSGEPQFVQDFDELFPTTWRETARESGFAAGAALPFMYDDVMYGVLAVYDTQSGRFDETEQRLLTELAETVAFAIHSIETEHALTADTAIRATLQLRGADTYIDDLVRSSTRAGTEAATTVHGTLPYDDDRFIQYVTVDESHTEAFEEAARSHPDVSDVTVLTDTVEPRLQIIVTEPPPEDRLSSLGIVVSKSTVTPQHIEMEIKLPEKQRLSEAVDLLGEEYDTVSVLSTVEIDRTESTIREAPLNTTTLTEKQAAALRAAYHNGYFEQPRTNSASDIAASLGITHSTFLQHLRTAQQKVFSEHYD